MNEPLQYLTDNSGVRTAVVLPISIHEALVEDLVDLAVIAERRCDPAISHSEFLEDLRIDGTV